ncbi:MAG TPA: DUF6660 family protein [Ferruginibacter sp.]|nr:DUF6660 family protein [Ferruginibacter sp.]
MKIFAFIMALIILALSVMPCADTAVGHENTVSAFSKAAHEAGDEQADDCSPFCICSCCAGFSINHLIPELLSNTFYLNTFTSNRVTSNVTAIASSIWQPPRKIS